jgi:hypothetical protein
MISRLVLAVGSLVLMGLVLEACLRLALFSERFAVDSLRNPGLYAHFDEDDYWKLHLGWSGFSGWLPGRHHPLLGESMPRTANNPLGLLEPRLRFPSSDLTEPVILFYGDSYLASPLAEPFARIPALLEERLGGGPVLNFGMGGWGLDQMVLRFEMTHDRFRNPLVLMGVLTGDVDRCVLSVRQGQKPRYVIGRDGTLELTNVPIERDQAAYLRMHPPQVRFWLLRLAAIALSRSEIAKTIPALQWNHHTEEKEGIAAALIGRTVAECRRRQIPLCFLIFYPPGDREGEGQSATFLRKTFEELGACYVDTRPVLQDAVANGRLSPEDLFDRRTAHHTALANEVIVEALVRQWSSIQKATPQ